MIGKIILFSIITLIIIYLIIQAILCKKATNKAYNKLNAYNVSNFNSSFGNINYLDKGKGESILVFHGIFGGYDQGYETIQEYEKKYRLICPSRFGYLGSDMPNEATVKMQVQAFKELLDSLNIEKTFLLGTSAGATYAIRFALEYPERTKGLILISPAAPLTEKPTKIMKYAGPPKALLSNYKMWIIKPLYPIVMGLSSDSINSLLPVKERVKGIIFDSAISNTDMANNYDDYNIESLLSPTIIFQAKDDKMANFDKTKACISRFCNCSFHAFETGGHMLIGNDIGIFIDEFINTNK